MSLSPTTGTMISQSDAADFTANFRAANPGATKAIFFGVDKINALLVTGVIGIRIYYGIDNTGAPELVLVGVDENEDDVLKRILDRGARCPVECGSPNALNGLA